MKIQSLLLGSAFFSTIFILLPLGMTFLNTQLSLPVVSNVITKVIGIVLIVSGISLFIYCSKLFVLIGKGTPAPIEPPVKLVTNSLYRITRNPIYFGYFFIFFGIALYFGYLLLYLYAALSIIAINIFVIYYEEPGLRIRFGKSYEEYCKKIPRWL